VGIHNASGGSTSIAYDYDQSKGLNPKGLQMILLLALLIVLLFTGFGFAVHVLWFLAVVFFVLWLIGFALGRGESSGRHHFYRW
jgi:hypothetical protein